MDTINVIPRKEYNHITIFIFIVPMLYSYYLNLYKYVIINLMALTSGFIYHYSYYNGSYSNKTVKLLKVTDMIVVHTVISYMLYISAFYNIYYYTGILCVVVLITLYYIMNQVPHELIHIISGIGVCFSIKSCDLNRLI
jgi:hypothetical protein